MSSDFWVGKTININIETGIPFTQEEWDAEMKKIANSTGRYCSVLKVDRKTKTIYIETVDSTRIKK